MKRATNKRPSESKTYAFVVDGDCERWYVELIKNYERSFAAQVKPELKQPKTLEEQYKLVVELAPSYDYVLWIIDLDVVIRETRECREGKITPIEKLRGYLGAIKQINEENREEKREIITIINNPCLEFWLLLHFNKTTKYYATCADLLPDLRKNREMADYEKSEKYYKRRSGDLYAKLKPFLKTAISNSEFTNVKFSFENYEAGVAQMCALFDLEELKYLK